LLSGSYRSVTVLIDTRFSTLVPLALFNADKKDLYLTFNLNMDLTGMTVRSDQISLIEAVNLYPVAGPLEGLLRKAFRNPVMLHFTTSLLQNVLLQLPFPTHPVTACLYVRHGRFDLLIRKEHRLVYCNSFIYKAIEDVVYYLMFVSEQLHLAAEGIHLTFMGEMGRYSMLVELLGKYIREIEFMPRNDQFRYGNVFDELPGHYFFNLLNAGLCEL
jgi:hypothetical protein